MGVNIFPASTKTFTNNIINGNAVGAQATGGNVTQSIIIGNSSFTRGATASQSIMIGTAVAAGTGTNVASSILIGSGAGENFGGTGATFSNMTVIGPSALNNALSAHATGSVILGWLTAGAAANARFSNSFIAGASAANAASGATFSNAVVIGSNAMRNITGTTVSTANIIGHQVAQTAVNANFDNANLIGQNIGQNASGANFSSAIAIGNTVAQNATGATFSNAVFIGSDSGTNCSLDNSNSLVLGSSSAKFGGQTNSVVIGSSSHQGVTGTQLQSNIAIGQATAPTNSTNNNIFIGAGAAPNLTGGSGKHTIIGYNTAGGLTGGTSNTIIGSSITGLTGTLSNNILISDGDGAVRIQVNGATAAYINTPILFINSIKVGKANNVYRTTAVGADSLSSASLSGQENTAVGELSLTAITTGGYNTAIGVGTAYQATSAANNFFGGWLAGSAISSGSNNVTIGADTGSNNNYTEATLIGYRAGRVNQATATVAIGANALVANTSGQFNTAVGYYAGQTNTTGSSSTYIGYQAGYAATGSGNTFVGVGLSGATGSNQLLISSGSGTQLYADGTASIRVYNMFIPKVDTTAGITGTASPVAGMLAWSSNDNHYAFYNGTAWRKLNDSAL